MSAFFTHQSGTLSSGITGTVCSGIVGTLYSGISGTVWSGLFIEVHPASDVFRLFERMVNQGIDSRLEGFTLSRFGYRIYDSIGVRAFFNFHRSEIHIIRDRLAEIFDPYLDDLITQWLDLIENYQFE